MTKIECFVRNVCVGSVYIYIYICWAEVVYGPNPWGSFTAARSVFQAQQLSCHNDFNVIKRKPRKPECDKSSPAACPSTREKQSEREPPSEGTHTPTRLHPQHTTYRPDPKLLPAAPRAVRYVSVYVCTPVPYVRPMYVLGCKQYLPTIKARTCRQARAASAAGPIRKSQGPSFPPSQCGRVRQLPSSFLFSWGKASSSGDNLFRLASPWREEGGLGWCLS